MVLKTLKNHVIESIIGHFSSPMDGLMVGMVFGDATLLPSEFKHSIKLIGMQHVVAASGANIAMVKDTIQIGIGRFSRFGQVLILSVGITGYTIMADSSPSIVRAALMSLLMLIGKRIFFRKAQPTWTLLLTCCVMIIYDSTVVESLSFQLSALATYGVLAVTPLLSGVRQSVLTKKTAHNRPNQKVGFQVVRKIAASLISSFEMTVAAQWFTVPLILVRFGQLSTVSLVSNTMLSELMPVITIAGFIFTAEAILLPMVTEGTVQHFILDASAAVMSIPVTMLVWGVGAFSQWPHALVEWHWSWQTLIFWFLATAVVLCSHSWLQHKQTQDFFFEGRTEV
jgi:competence protein ComEC